MVETIFFKDTFEFRNWLDKNHSSHTELFVGFFKVKSGKLNMKWADAVDVALCYGWIDGVMKPIDADSYALRFTPRRTGSIWSNVNIKKVEGLIQKGLIMPAGIAAFEKRTAAKSGIYSFENAPQKLEPVYEKKFRENKKAWTFFTSMAPSYQKLAIHRIMSAKQEVTRMKRLDAIIQSCHDGIKIT